VLARLEQTNKITLKGNFEGDKLLSEVSSSDEVGFTPHLVLTGIESIYEGITISAVRGPAIQFRSLMRSSDRKVVTALHDKEHQRILIDGGFTRLYEDKWARTAGTSRFVTNAARWLYNFEGRVQHKKDRKKQADKKTASKVGTGNSEAVNLRALLRQNGGTLKAQQMPDLYLKDFGVTLSYKKKGIKFAEFMALIPDVIKCPSQPSNERSFVPLTRLTWIRVGHLGSRAGKPRSGTRLSQLGE
jgi:hypothetical protein